MRGYRALLAAGGPEQPLLLERILALARGAAGVVLRRPRARAPGARPVAAVSRRRTPRSPRSRSRRATRAKPPSHLTQLAQHASADGDDDQAALAALAGARLLRVLEPQGRDAALRARARARSGLGRGRRRARRSARRRAALARARAPAARARGRPPSPRARSQLRLRLADVFVHQLGDPASAQHELAAARALAPDDPAVHEMTATILGDAAIRPRRSTRGARSRGSPRRAAITRTRRARYAIARRAARDSACRASARAAEAAWRRALELDPLQTDAIAGLATAAAARGDHGAAAELYERLRGLGLPQHIAARHELMLARSLVALGRIDDARASLRRATLAGGETAAEAHAVLAEIAEADERSRARRRRARHRDQLARRPRRRGRRRATSGCYTRAAELAVARATLLDNAGQPQQATADWERAHELAHEHAPEIARDAARTMLSRARRRRSPSGAGSTPCSRRGRRPPSAPRCSSAAPTCAAASASPDLAAAIADLHEALALLEDDEPEHGRRIAPPRVPARGRAARAERRPARTRPGARGARASSPSAPATASRSRPPRPPRGSPPTSRPPPCPTARARTPSSRPTCRPALRREVLTRSARPRGASARGPT